MKLLDKVEIPTSNLPPYMKTHIDIEKHPYCTVTIEEITPQKTQITIRPSNKKFYE